jgi:hypothetical protein
VDGGPCPDEGHVNIRHRFRRLNIVRNLARMRNALLAIIPFDEKKNQPSLIADDQDNKRLAIQLILRVARFADFSSQLP